MLHKILYYTLSFRPGLNGRVNFRLEGEPHDRTIDLSTADFIALALVLAQKDIAYDIPGNYFCSYDNAIS
jgi:hypothetical protein